MERGIAVRRQDAEVGDRRGRSHNLGDRRCGIAIDGRALFVGRGVGVRRQDGQFGNRYGYGRERTRSRWRCVSAIVVTVSVTARAISDSGSRS